MAKPTPASPQGNSSRPISLSRGNGIAKPSGMNPALQFP